MAQGSRQVQTQAQQQIQTLSPQQILVVKLLELPTVELEERIHSEILDNPALEEGTEMPENEDDNTEYVENEDGNTDSNTATKMIFPIINYRNIIVPKKE